MLSSGGTEQLRTSPGTSGCTWPVLPIAVPSEGSVLAWSWEGSTKPASICGWAMQCGSVQDRQKGMWRTWGAGALQTACFFQLLAARSTSLSLQMFTVFMAAEARD